MPFLTIIFLTEKFFIISGGSFVSPPQFHCSDRRNRLLSLFSGNGSYRSRLFSVGSVEFRQFPCSRIPVQFPPEKFRYVPQNFNQEFVGNRQNPWELIGTRPTKCESESCCKEIVGIQRNRSVPTYQA